MFCTYKKNSGWKKCSRFSLQKHPAYKKITKLCGLTKHGALKTHPHQRLPSVSEHQTAPAARTQCTTASARMLAAHSFTPKELHSGNNLF